MRKNYKRKRRSCALCKPHKVGWDKRWKPKEAARRMEMEHEKIGSGLDFDNLRIKKAPGHCSADA